MPVFFHLKKKNLYYLVVENFEAASWRDLADGGGVEPMVVVAVARLHEDSGITQALRVHLSPNIVQVYSFT